MKEEKTGDKSPEQNCLANDQVNPDAANGVSTSETEFGGSGSTDCSFSAINREQMLEQIVNACAKGGYRPIGGYKNQAQIESWYTPSLEFAVFFQNVIDRHGLKFSPRVNFWFKADEWDYLMSFLHLSGEFRECLPVVN